MKEKIFLAVRSFSKAERIVFLALFLLAIIGVLGMLFVFNSYFLKEIPRNGGSFTEGIIGNPQYINPILAVSQPDQDATALVYSGLMRLAPYSYSDGGLIPDLAQSYELSEDGRTYTFVLKPDLYWQDGQPITSEDVRFTIKKIQDPTIHSPKRPNWEGVIVEAPDERTVVFTLPSPYASFLENTTIGILPAHLWSGLSPDEFTLSTLNTHPVGSGPYAFKDSKQNVSGLTEYSDFVAFPGFALGVPNISQVRFRFYTNENELLSAYRDGEVDATSAISPEEMVKNIGEKRKAQLVSAPLPRVFGVFFNQNEQDVFTDPAVRKALDKAVDKDRIVHDILFGHATILGGLFPPGAFGFSDISISALPVANNTPADDSDASSTSSRIAQAKEILSQGGWKYDEKEKAWKKRSGKETKILAFSLSTSDVPEVKAVAESLSRDWAELGAKVTLQVFNWGELSQNIIRPRKYQALLFGEIVGRNPDLYAFWHSSQRTDPGLNVSLYASVPADKILEKSRETLDTAERMKLYREFQDIIIEDTPAVFLYSPEFLYLLPSQIKNVELPSIMSSPERFANVYQWYIDTDKIWKIFY